MDRWNEIIEGLGNPFTIGRYTGLTPENERRRMRASPPAVLVTNFAMLEYLLERPIDSPLWEHGHDLGWIVLDEAHTYTGAVGIDVAMLIRRLKQRFGISRGKIRCIATSATLPITNREEVLKSMSNLLGEEVLDKSIFFGDYLNPRECLTTEEEYKIEPKNWDFYARLLEMVEAKRTLNEVLSLIHI